jgi:hypothetical protein
MGRATSLATALFAGCVLLNLLAVASGPAAATTSVATTAAAATTACAAPPSAPVSGTWTCSFDDEFAGASLDRTTWVPQTSGFVTGTAAYHACYVDDPRVVAQSGGALHLSVVTTSELHSCDPNLSATNLIGGMVTQPGPGDLRGDRPHPEVTKLMVAEYFASVDDGLMRALRAPADRAGALARRRAPRA